MLRISSKNIDSILDFWFTEYMAGERERRNTGRAPQASKLVPTTTVKPERVARQERSIARIEQLLDAAESVFDSAGIDAATMTDVAAAAKTSIGTLYHWFPDKAAITKALSERMLRQFVEALTPYMVDRIDEPTSVLVTRALTEMADFGKKHPAFSVMLEADPSSGSRMHDALAAVTQGLIESRVPGIDPHERNLAADTAVAVARQMLATFDRWPKKDRDLITEEYRFLLMSYLIGKYPAEDSPAWTVAPEGHRPSRSGRSTRLLNADRKAASPKSRPARSPGSRKT